MQKVKFINSIYGRVMGFMAGIPCIPTDKERKPKVGETWLVEMTGKDAMETIAYVRPVRLWQGTPDDHKAVIPAHINFKNGTVKFFNRFTFPMENTSYAQLWNDYQVLAQNMNAVIIRGDSAIRWNKRSKPPQVMPLNRFATKYKRQPLLGKNEDVEYFLENLEKLRAMSITEAQKKKCQA